jgi:hypothetical protein
VRASLSIIRHVVLRIKLRPGLKYSDRIIWTTKTRGGFVGFEPIQRLAVEFGLWLKTPSAYLKSLPNVCRKRFRPFQKAAPVALAKFKIRQVEEIALVLFLNQMRLLKK